MGCVARITIHPVDSFGRRRFYAIWTQTGPRRWIYSTCGQSDYGIERS
jgi:hypothetical protein